MILLRCRKSFRNARRPRHPTVKITRRERTANRRARRALVEELRPLMVEVFDAFRLDVDDQLRRRLVAGGTVGLPQAALEGLEANFASLMSDAYLDSLLEGVNIGLRFGGAPAGITVPTELITEAAQSWISQAGADRVARISRGTRGAIQQAVGDVVTLNASPQAAITRISQQVGLDKNRARQLRNFERRLAATRIPTPDADTQFVRETIAQDVENFRERLLRDRASAILETEVQEAVMNGERIFWQEAIKSEQVDGSVLLKRWHTVEDQRVCPICRPLDGSVTKFNDSYSSLSFLGLGPPAHPRCRCFLEFAPTGSFET